MNKKGVDLSLSIWQVFKNTIKKIIYDFGSRSKTFPLFFGMVMIIGFYVKIDVFIKNNVISVVWLLVAFLLIGTGVGSNVLQKYIEALKDLKGGSYDDKR